MKKISLICATLLAGLSLSACNNLASQKSHKASSSSVKIVKRHKHHKKTEKKKKVSSSQVASSSRSANGTSTQASKANKMAPSSSAPTNDHPDHVVNDSSGTKDYSNETIRVGENGVTKYDWNGNASDPAQQSSATSAATSLNDAGIVKNN